MIRISDLCNKLSLGRADLVMAGLRLLEKLEYVYTEHGYLYNCFVRNYNLPCCFPVSVVQCANIEY